MQTHCKACLDSLDPKAEWRKTAPPSTFDPGDYCRACYFEKATGAIPKVVGSHVTRGSGGLTYRQAVKKH